jgi:Fe-S oxidoreductase
MENRTVVDTFVEETGGYIAAQLEACTRCGMCAEACHFYQATGKPEYAPVWKMENLKRAYEQRFTLVGKIKLGLGIDKRISDDEIQKSSRIVYEACTLCNKCAMACPMGIQLGTLIHNVRTAYASAGFVPKDLEDDLKKQLDEGSPLGVTDDIFADRMDWVADEWEVNIPTDVQGADTLVVFTSIEIMKFPQNIAAIAKILNAAGEKWTISTKAREVVNFGLFEGSAEQTTKILKRVFDGATELGVKNIIVTECGHAYEALRWTSYNLMDVPEGIQIKHIVGLIGEYLHSGRIKLKEGSMDGAGIVTFHDACKIQRRGGHIKEPREILNILAPTKFKEMTPNREQAICCGGGGGVIAIQEADENRYAVFKLKMDQIKNINAETVVMCCSNCRWQFTDGKEHFKANFQIAGLSQLVADALSE